MNFLTFLTEASEGKNLHLEHLEDQIFNKGVVGARDSILFLRSLRDMLAGHTQNPIFVTTKFDGAPAIFAGINPDNGKFFVGTKSVFIKNPKLNYTVEDIVANHGSMPGLVRKLKVALQYLPQLGITGVWQGDVMFTREDLKETVIDGEQYLTFQPNTIVYAVPLDSQLSRSMQRAQIGIVWHTQYSGDKLSDMTASFKPNTNQLNLTPDVWYRDARFIDASGAATFTEAETAYVTNLLSNAGTLFQKMDGALLNYIAQNSTIKTEIKTFNNSRIKSGIPFTNSHDHVVALIKWVEDRANKDILISKQAPTTVKREGAKTAKFKFYRSNFNGLVSIFDMLNYILAAKHFIIKKLQTVKGLGTFLRTENGFKVTSPEGFVAIDHEGKALKLVDRLEFSKANFAANKNWDEDFYLDGNLPFLTESGRGGKAAEIANDLGLKYLGFGRYGNKGKATHEANPLRSKLVKLKKPLEHAGHVDFKAKNIKAKIKAVALKSLKNQSNIKYKTAAVVKRANLEQLEKETNAWMAKASKKEKEALKEYSGEGYEYINDALWSGRYDPKKAGKKKPPVIPKISDFPNYDAYFAAMKKYWRELDDYQSDSSDIIKAIDDVFSKHKTTQELVVYRSVSKRDNLSNMKPGDVKVMKGYTSTSLVPEVSLEFNGDPSLIIIRVPKGSKAIYMGVISHQKHENEILLARGAKLKMIRKEESKTMYQSDRNRYIFDYIGNDDK